MTEEARPPSGPGGQPPAYPSSGLPATAPAPAGVGRPAPVPQPPRETWRPPRRVDPVPGTPFGLAYLDVPPITSGLAVGALVAGIGALVVSLVVFCFGLIGASEGWGAWVAGAFAVLGTLLGAAAVLVGVLGRRQTRPGAASGVRYAGSALAVSGIWCGAAGLALNVLGFGLAVLLQVG